jgi:pimeloyl-ACP methyl ester carboxylesterase
MPYITVKTGIKIYYERIGKGPPLLLIMGTGLDHSCWDPQIKAYSKRYECICFDNRGTGKTDAPRDPLTTRLMAEDTAHWPMP